jgi:hypothetical protein
MAPSTSARPQSKELSHYRREIVMCEAEWELEDLKHDYRELKKKYQALQDGKGIPRDEDPDITNDLCDVIDDLARGVLTLDEFFDRTALLRRPSSWPVLRAVAA